MAVKSSKSLKFEWAKVLARLWESYKTIKILKVFKIIEIYLAGHLNFKNF